MLLRSIIPIAAALILLALAPQAVKPVVAQDLQYTTKTSIELPGTAGTVVRWAQRLSGGSNETVETVYLKDGRMRTDSDGSSTILDVQGGSMTFLDHQQKTYSTMTFADMLAMSEEVLADAEQALNEARHEAAGTDSETRRALEEEGIDLRYDVRVDRTGETRSILGHRAERVLLIMQAEGSRVAQAEDEEDVEGALVVATELWLTSDSSGELAPLFAFEQESAAAMSGHLQDMSAASQSFTQGLAAAFASDPQMREMTEKAASEMAKMEGVSLASTMKMVIVPGGVTFDPRSAFGEEEPREQVSATRQAGRLARGLVRNRLGRGGNDAQEAEEPEERTPRQSTMFTVRTEITDVSRASLDNALFEAPGDYRESPLFQRD
jgi:hypothetical protein